MAALKLFAYLTVALWGISQARDVILPLCLAALFSILLSPGVSLFRRCHLPESLALVLTALVFLLPLAALIYEAIVQGEALVRELPTLFHLLKKTFDQLAMSHWG